MSQADVVENHPASRKSQFIKVDQVKLEEKTAIHVRCNVSTESSFKLFQIEFEQWV
jgi:hypothetical protein